MLELSTRNDDNFLAISCVRVCALTHTLENAVMADVPEVAKRSLSLWRSLTAATAEASILSLDHFDDDIFY